MAKADAIVKAKEREAEEQAAEAKTAATAEAILRAGAVARGEIIELPTNETALAFVAAGRKRRGEPDGD